MDIESFVTGRVQDQSGNAHHARVDGAVFVPGQVGDALQFRPRWGSNLRVDDADELDPGGAFTIAAWIKPAGFGSNDLGAIELEVWQHVAVVLGNRQVKFHVNARPMGVRGSPAQSQPAANDEELRIGLYRDEWLYFSGEFERLAR